MKRAIILVLDSLGIGETDDAYKFGDTGANTLGSIAKYCFNQFKAGKRKTPLYIPNLSSLGLAKACVKSSNKLPIGLNTDTKIIASYGYAKELSSGKDTPSGHWEMAGVPVLFDWGYFSDRELSFPKILLDQIISETNIPGYLGNCHASGTEIINRYGKEHMQTGKPIFYTSADSVFQIACHEESFGLDNLINLCEKVRAILEPYNIGRVIARPFIGTEENFQRTGNRRDLSIPPPDKTVLQKLIEEKSGSVISIGKIADIFADQGITHKIKANGLNELFNATLAQVKNPLKNDNIIFTNFVDFDSLYGHRRDVEGYANALELFDQYIPKLLSSLSDDDLLFITADHGCDPTWPGSDHTREHVPILFYKKDMTAKYLGPRESFADIGQTIANYFNVTSMKYGKSFL